MSLTGSSYNYRAGISVSLKELKYILNYFLKLLTKRCSLLTEKWFDISISAVQKVLLSRSYVMLSVNTILH